MKILILSYSYAPSLTPRAFRWMTIAEHWAKLGHHVDVLCEKSIGRPDDEIINGVHIHRAGHTPRLPSKSTASHPSMRFFGLGSVRRLAKIGFRYAWRKLYWPDYAFLWYWAALRRARNLLKTGAYDILYSSSIPFTGHLVGLALKKDHPDLRWIVDTGDPFSFADGAPVNNFLLYGRLNCWAEKKVFEAANAISVTTNATRQRYNALFPSTGSKIMVIPPLLSDFFGKTSEVSPVFSGLFRTRLVFLGTLYKDIRNPAGLLACFVRLLAELPDHGLELHFFGDSSQCPETFQPYADLLNTSIQLHGLVPQAVAVQAMKEADFLVNIGNNTFYQLPSKVVEYLAINKPILNFVNSAQDSSADFFQAYEGVLSISANEASQVPQIFAQLMDFVKNPPTINPQRRQMQLDQFRAGHLANVYLGLPTNDTL